MDIVASDKGLLIPRVAFSSATYQGTILTPAVSLLVYHTGASTLTYKGI